MKIEFIRDVGNLKKGLIIPGICPVEGARLMSQNAAKEIGTCPLDAATLKRMSMSQLKAMARSRKVAGYTDMDRVKLTASLVTVKKAVGKKSVKKKAKKKAKAKRR